MTQTKLLLAATALAATALPITTSTAWAQSPPAQSPPAQSAGPGAPAAVSVLNGPVIAGVCVLSSDAVLSASKVGMAVAARLQQLSQTAQAEVAPERAALEADAKALQTPAKGTTAVQLDKQRTALGTRAKALQDKVAGINRELEYTRNHEYEIISADAQPLLVAAYHAHGCGLLFRRESLLAGNPTNDLTPEVVKSLDAKVTTLTFDRMPVPQLGLTPR